MIQFYINNRPVPRAIARAHLITAWPDNSDEFISEALKKLAKKDNYFIKLCADYGVSASKI